MTDRYRKKSVKVRAWKIGFDGQEPDWVREAFDGERIDWCPAGEGLYINTPEGRMKANIGDMLIEGVQGELYGYRADIFAATYEPVETTLAAQQQPTEGEEIMVNTPYGVFTLPLHPSGLSSGPRFVVHVPELQRESVTVRYDLSPAQTESAIRDALIRMGWTPPDAAPQQSAAVDDVVVERIAALLHEVTTGDPWTVAGVEHPGPDRDYYRGLARKVAAIAKATGEVK